MRSVILLSVLSAALLGLGCSAGGDIQDDAPGPNGEPPKALKGMRLYSRQFNSDQASYVMAFGKLHSYLVSNGYYPFTYTSCFGDVPNAVSQGREKQFPCVAMHAQKGAPTKGHIVVTVDGVKFNQLDHNNRVTYTVSIYGLERFAGPLTSALEADLDSLYTTGRPSGPAVAP